MKKPSEKLAKAIAYEAKKKQERDENLSLIHIQMCIRDSVCVVKRDTARVPYDP